MKSDLRYNIQNIGTIFVGAIQKTANSAQNISKRVISDFDFNSLTSKKRKISDEIIRHVSVLIKEGNSEICHDDTLSKLVARLDTVEQDLAGYKKTTTRTATPITSMITKLGRSIFKTKNK